MLFSLTGISILRLFELGFVGKGLNVTVNEEMKPVTQNTSQTVQKFSERQRRGRGGWGGEGSFKGGYRRPFKHRSISVTYGAA